MLKYVLRFYVMQLERMRMSGEKSTKRMLTDDAGTFFGFSREEIRGSGSFKDNGRPLERTKKIREGRCSRTSRK